MLIPLSSLAKASHKATFNFKKEQGLVISFVVILWWGWCLNLGLHTHKASALLLEPFL
jgi:hypothetical protein